MTYILLIGKNGQVGWELQRTLVPLGHVVAMDYPEIDLTNIDGVIRIMREVKPSVLVNAAAYTAVDSAENDAEKALAINGTAPGVLAEEAKKLGAVFVHYSTDYVFNGNKGTPYNEEDTPSPINTYGKTKLAGERALEQVGGAYLILRTSWVFGLRGSNFLLTMLKLAEERKELRVVNDQLGAPTWSRMLAESTAIMLAQGPEKIEANKGIYHLTAGGVTSWYGFVSEIIRLAGKSVQVSAVRTLDYPTPAKRPAYSVLNNAKIHERFGVRMPNWDTMLRMAMEDKG